MDPNPIRPTRGRARGRPQHSAPTDQPGQPPQSNQPFRPIQPRQNFPGLPGQQSYPSLPGQQGQGFRRPIRPMQPAQSSIQPIQPFQTTKPAPSMQKSTDVARLPRHTTPQPSVPLSLRTPRPLGPRATSMGDNQDIMAGVRS